MTIHGDVAKQRDMHATGPNFFTLTLELCHIIAVLTGFNLFL